MTHEMRDYVQQQTAALLTKLAAEVDRAAGDATPDAIHDLRVSIRRLSRCLRAFAQFYPGRSWKKARAELSDLLHTAGEVRDRDIALEMLAKAGMVRRSVIIAKLEAQRAKAHGELVNEIRRWRDRKITGKWRSRLEV
ncbi:MAG TPA: CHAD domain-containing protein [Bryobacteraceae bacterium]|nr:CHAD domain-containing protein [Bryobacteraceae bacterium]